MLRSMKSVKGFAIQAEEGKIGEVSDFYFDDEMWVVRYLVADTGSWLSSREVLIASVALEQPDWEERTFPVDLTKDQVERAPSRDTDKPVSRQFEAELHSHYNWASYWPPNLFYGYAWIPREAPDTGTGNEVREKIMRKTGDQEYNTHLRSMNEVLGYSISALDGSIGHMEDFIAEDGSFNIRYAVVDTRTLLPGGKKTIVAPSWIRRVNWSDEKVTVDLTKNEIKEGPEYDPSEPVNRKYEERLYDYYGRPRYWME